MECPGRDVSHLCDLSVPPCLAHSGEKTERRHMCDKTVMADAFVNSRTRGHFCGPQSSDVKAKYKSIFEMVQNSELLKA